MSNFENNSTKKALKTLSFLFIFTLFSLHVLPSQEGSVDYTTDEEITNEESIEEETNVDLDEVKDDDLPTFPIIQKGFRIVGQYYGLPLSVKFGYFYRNSDFSIFPNVAFNLLRDGSLVLNTSSGITLQKSFFTWQIDSFYDIVPFTMNKILNKQVAYAVNQFSFYINGSILSFITSFGNKRKILKSTHNISTNFELSQGLRLDAFLTDLGYFKSTLSTAFFVRWTPISNFIDYSIFLDVPATVNLYYVDIAFMYSFYNTGRINAKEAKVDYIIEKAQSVVTARDSFKAETLYSTLHLFSSELRWYPTRTKDNAKRGGSEYNTIAKTNGFFLSLFADLGFAITEKHKYNFIAEYGLGAGYTLFDCVPFTFQVGLNQRTEPVFFLGVVSKIVHLP